MLSGVPNNDNKSASAVLLLTLMAATGASAQVNMGDQKAEASLPFTMTKVASFDTQIWRIAFLPDGRFLAAEKGGRLWLMTQQGAKTAVANVPAVLYQGQGGLLGVFLSPHYATDHYVYLTYSEPHEEPGAPPPPPAAAVAPAGPPAAAAAAGLRRAPQTPPKFAVPAWRWPAPG